MTIKNRPLLIVEDDAALSKQIMWSLDGFMSVQAADRESALAQFRRVGPAVITMDLGLPPDPDSVSEGFRLLEELLDLDPRVKIIVITGQNGQAHALRAIELGAYDFIAKPFEPEVLSLVVARAFWMYELQTENERLRQLRSDEPNAAIITRDDAMLRTCRLVEKVAPSNVTVLLLGESGTGKELFAQSLHFTSKRPGRLVAINCAAIPENLLESELFGYERGAFTGAAKTAIGKIESADRGTLLLDEIGDLPWSLQGKLLRFLQEHKVERLGGRQEIAVDIRVVCATHEDLKALIRQGRFREDLYFRLAEITVQIPPLRERKGDAVLLAHAFLRRFAEEQHMPSIRLAKSAVLAIEQYAWPGNVREIISVIKRAVILADGNRVTAEDLGLPAAAPTLDAAGEELDLRTIRETAERGAVVTALARTDGNVVKAAELLGVSRPTLYDLMHRLSIRSDT
jgi:two-component system, NtrC family, response regulator